MQSNNKDPLLQLLIDARTTAKLLDISEKHLWNHTVPRGKIPCVRIGERVLYDPSDLRNLIEKLKGGSHA